MEIPERKLGESSPRSHLKTARHSPAVSVYSVQCPIKLAFPHLGLLHAQTRPLQRPAQASILERSIFSGIPLVHNWGSKWPSATAMRACAGTPVLCAGLLLFGSFGDTSEPGPDDRSQLQMGRRTASPFRSASFAHWLICWLRGRSQPGDFSYTSWSFGCLLAQTCDVLAEQFQSVAPRPSRRNRNLFKLGLTFVKCDLESAALVAAFCLSNFGLISGSLTFFFLHLPLFFRVYSLDGCGLYSLARSTCRSSAASCFLQDFSSF